LATGITFHTRHHVDATLAAASEVGARVALITPPGGAANAGPEIYLEMIHQARGRFPEAYCEAMVDCGADAGTAMRALRCGWRHLVFTGNDNLRRKIQSMTDHLGGSLEQSRPPSVDLLAARDPDRRVRHALTPSASS